MNDFGWGILSTDRPAKLERLLSSMDFYAEDPPPVFVFDDSGQQGERLTADVCSRFPFVTFLKTGERLGVSGNTNQAIRFLSGKYPAFAILNDDMEILREGWEWFYAEALQRTGFHHFSFRQYGLWKAVPHMRSKPGEIPDTSSLQNGVEIRTIPEKPHGCLLVFDSVAVGRVGYFDAETFPRYGMEHVDFSNRVSLSGIQPPGIHDVADSNLFFKTDLERDPLPPQRIHQFRFSKIIFESDFKNNRERIFIPYSSPAPPVEVPAPRPENPHVSIVVTAYQTQDFLWECLESLINQDYFQNGGTGEIIVVNDACPDVGEAITKIRRKTILRNARQPAFLWRRLKENAGTYIATNTGLEAVSGHLFVRFDSDDIAHPNMLSKIVNWYRKGFDFIRFACANFRDGENGERLFEIQRKLKIPSGVFAVSSALLKKLGGFQPWRCSADTDFTRRAESIGKTKTIRRELFDRRVHPQSLTQNPDTGMGSEYREQYRLKIQTTQYLPENAFVKPEIAPYLDLKSR